MKAVLFAIALCLPLSAQSPLDLSALDRLEAKARNHTSITLNSQLLKLAAGIFNSGDDSDLRNLVSTLSAVYVRTLEFDRPGQYTEADMEPIRSVLRRAPWSRIVDVREGSDSSEIWVAQQPSGEKFSGVVIINAEPRELTVIHVAGLIGPEDLARLNGHFGIDVDALDKVVPKPPSKKKDEK